MCPNYTFIAQSGEEGMCVDWDTSHGFISIFIKMRLQLFSEAYSFKRTHMHLPHMRTCMPTLSGPTILHSVSIERNTLLIERDVNGQCFSIHCLF
jgi:hypothetical protein